MVHKSLLGAPGVVTGTVRSIPTVIVTPLTLLRILCIATAGAPSSGWRRVRKPSKIKRQLKSRTPKKPWLCGSMLPIRPT